MHLFMLFLQNSPTAFLKISQLLCQMENNFDLILKFNMAAILVFFIFGEKLVISAYLNEKVALICDFLLHSV